MGLSATLMPGMQSAATCATRRPTILPPCASSLLLGLLQVQPLYLEQVFPPFLIFSSVVFVAPVTVLCVLLLLFLQ